MEKNVKVNEFVEKYNGIASENIKDKLVSELVFRNYVPVLEKKYILETMFNRSIVKNDINIYVDEFFHSINLTMAILMMYTKLDLTDSETDIYDDYDKLVEAGILSSIIEKIGKEEMTRIFKIDEEIYSSFENRTNSINAIINRGVDVIKSVSEGTIKTLVSPEVIEIFTQGMEKLNERENEDKVE